MRFGTVDLVESPVEAVQETVTNPQASHLSVCDKSSSNRKHGAKRAATKLSDPKIKVEHVSGSPTPFLTLSIEGMGAHKQYFCVTATLQG